jgi:photosystem II stability/assembly factor-like uncharacterized protein
MSDGLPEGCTFIASLAIDPQDTGTIYAAFRGYEGACVTQQDVVGGLWKTSDGGTSWTKLGPQPKGGGFHGILIDPRDSSTLYAWNGMGIYKSTDRGANWDTLDLGLSGRTRIDSVDGVIIDPQNPSTLYAVISGHGILKSSDGGASWSAVNSGLAISTNGDLIYPVNFLVIDPRHPGTLYAGGSGVYRSGVYRSTDGGASWSSVNTGLTTLNVYTLAIDPQDTRTVYAGTAGGVFTITFTEDGL